MVGKTHPIGCANTDQFFPTMAKMVALNNFARIIAAIAVLASTFSSAAPSPSPEKVETAQEIRRAMQPPGDQHDPWYLIFAREDLEPSISSSKPNSKKKKRRMTANLKIKGLP